MTFSGKIKEEISKLEVDRVEAISELSGIFSANADIKLYSIKVQTENINAANRIFKLIKSLYNVTCNIIVRKNYNFKKNEVYIIEIKKNVPEIIKDIGLIGETGFKIDSVPKDEIVADDNLKAAFIRGSFLLNGSINDPKISRYHLEIISNSLKHAEFLNKLINSFNLNSKVLRRKKGYMVYIKESEKISDFLKLIKAYNAVMYFEDIRIYREKINMNNRINNCEQANTEKSLASANKQIEDIEFIKEKDAYDLLDEKLKEVAEYRLKYKDSSLIELSEIISTETNKKITKSCVNHRLRKIRELANKLREN